MTEPARTGMRPCAGTPSRLSAERAAVFADLALANVATAWPHKLDHVLTSAADVVAPAVLHPAFHGSYDWHSCVHMHWLLVHLLRLFPDVVQRPAIEAVLDRNLSPAAIAGECAYLERPDAGTFERTYGWAWLLELATELGALDHPAGQRWQAALAPLAQAMAARYLDYLPRADYPIRHGLHANSAFGLYFALEHARAGGDGALESVCVAKAIAWFGADRDAPCAWEPSGSDFLSPVLMEAALMARVHAPPAFAEWLTGLLPGLGPGGRGLPPGPVRVADRHDAQIVHLDGLNLSRAWCLHAIARALPAGDARCPALAASADAHRTAGLAGMDAGGAFVGTHWLASFAALALLDPGP